MVQMRPGEGTYVIEESRLLIDRIMARGSLKTDKELQDVGEVRLILEVRNRRPGGRARRAR